MYRVKKTFEIAVSHTLCLPYESSCSRNHGHNMKITVWCASEELNQEGMVIDFTEIKKVVHGQLDHRCLNDIRGIGWDQTDPEGLMTELNPTAENLAQWICMQIDKCYRVDVQESIGNIATYIDDSVRSV